MYCRRLIGDGQSTASTWSRWPFAPIRFEGMTKHNMAGLLRAAFHNGQAAIPYVDDGSDALKAKNAANTHWGPSRLDDIGVDSSDFAAFIRQLGNVKSAPAKNAAYNTYKMANPKIGDDMFDAACAAVFAMVTAGIDDYQPSAVLTRAVTQAQLLGQL